MLIESKKVLISVNSWQFAVCKTLHDQSPKDLEESGDI